MALRTKGEGSPQVVKVRAMVLYGVLIPLGTNEAQLGVIPPSELLKEMVQLPPGNTNESTEQTAALPVPSEVRSSNGEEGVANKTQQEPSPEMAPKQYLVAPGLPTIPRKLAQWIWELDFVEMEDFLPTNKTIQALELAGISERVLFTNHNSKAGGLLT